MVQHEDIDHTGIPGVTGVTLPTAARYTRTSGDYTTSSTTFADVDGTNLALTIATEARRVQIGFIGTGFVSNASGIVAVDFTVDGTRQGGDFGLQLFHQHSTVSEGVPLSMVYLTAVLSAASHTFKLQWRVSNGAHTATLFGTTVASTLQMWVQETLSTT